MNNTATTKVYPVNPTSLASLKTNLAIMGVKAFVRCLPNGKARVTITNVADREATRDALVLSGCAGPSGKSFADAETARFAWQDRSVFVWFLNEQGVM